jgi:hypothetical protein
MDENGGVDSGIVSEGLDFSAYEQLPTQLSDDRRKMRYLSLMQHNSFQLACRADSSGSNTIELVLDLSLDRFGSSYTGSADSLFYADAFQDRSATFDTSSYLLLGVKPALDFSWKWVQTKMGLTLGMDWQQADVRVDTLEERGLYSIGRVHWYAERPHWKAALNARSVSGSWLNEGDYSLDGSLDWTTGSKTISNVRLEGGTFRLMPEYTMSRYHSNHFVWENDFAAEEIKSAKASLDMLNGALTLYSSYSVSENWVYADSNARPAQSMESLSLLSSGMKVVQKGKHWKVELALMYQKPDDERVRVPEWSGKIRIARRDEWFRHALKAEYGFSLYGVSDYTGLAYMPATGLLYLQSTERMGGQPVADFFFHAGMGRATLTLMVQRFNDGWWGGENRLAAGYPVPPRTIKFGLRWLLLN